MDNKTVEDKSNAISSGKEGKPNPIDSAKKDRHCLVSPAKEGKSNSINLTKEDKLYSIRLAKTDSLTDKQMLIRLWKDTFDDTEEFIDFFFGKRYFPENITCVLQDGKIVGAMHSLPVDLNLRQTRITSGIIAGVAVDKQHRGKGLMKEMFKFFLPILAERNILTVTYHPVNFDIYKSMGHFPTTQYLMYSPQPKKHSLDIISTISTPNTTRHSSDIVPPLKQAQSSHNPTQLTSNPTQSPSDITPSHNQTQPPSDTTHAPNPTQPSKKTPVSASATSTLTQNKTDFKDPQNLQIRMRELSVLGDDEITQLHTLYTKIAIKYSGMVLRDKEYFNLKISDYISSHAKVLTLHYKEKLQAYGIFFMTDITDMTDRTDMTEKTDRTDMTDMSDMSEKFQNTNSEKNKNNYTNNDNPTHKEALTDKDNSTNKDILTDKDISTNKDASPHQDDSTDKNVPLFKTHYSEIFGEEIIFTSLSDAGEIIDYLLNNFISDKFVLKLPAEISPQEILTPDCPYPVKTSIINQNVTGSTDILSLTKKLKLDRFADKIFLESFVIDVKDDFLEANNLTLNLLGELSPLPPVITADIGTYVQFLTGFISIRDLIKSSRINREFAPFFIDESVDEDKSENLSGSKDKNSSFTSSDLSNLLNALRSLHSLSSRNLSSPLSSLSSLNSSNLSGFLDSLPAVNCRVIDEY